MSEFVSIAEVERLKSLDRKFSKYVESTYDVFARNTHRARHECLMAHANATKLFIGKLEDRALRESMDRDCRYPDPSGRTRRQFMGLDVYVVDAESFVEVHE